MVRLVLFDIDGTLIRTGGAGMVAFGQTAELLYGIHGVADKTHFHGRTDSSLVREFLSPMDLPESIGKSVTSSMLTCIC